MSRRRIIGLDIGSCSLKLAEFIEKENRPYLLNSRIVNVNQDKNLRQALKELTAGMPLKKSRVVLVVNSPRAMVKNLIVPLMPLDELRRAITIEAKNCFPFSVEDYYLDFEIAAEIVDGGIKKKRVIVAVCPRELVDKNLEVLKDCSIRPSLIVTAALAMRNLLKLKKYNPSESIAAIDIGRGSCELIIVKAGELILNRDIPVCGDDFNNALMSELSTSSGRLKLSYEEAERIKINYGIPESANIALKGEIITAVQVISLLRPLAEKLFNEIERSFDFYLEECSAGRVSKLILFGGGASLKGLDGFLSEGLNMEVSRYDSLEGINLKKSGSDNPPAAIAAAAGACFCKPQGINLLPVRLKNELKTIIQQAVIKAVLSGVITFLALIYIGMRIQSSNLDKKIEGLNSELNYFNSNFGSISRWPYINNILIDEPYWDEVLMEINNLVPEGAYLKEIDIQPEGILLTGGIVSSESPQKITVELVSRLESGMFKDVRMQSLPDANSPDNEFRLKMSLE